VLIFRSGSGYEYSLWHISCSPLCLPIPKFLQRDYVQHNLPRNTAVLSLAALPVCCLLHFDLLYQPTALYRCLVKHSELRIGPRKKKKCSEEKPVCRRCRRNISSEPRICASSESSLPGELPLHSETPSTGSEVVISSKKSDKDDSRSWTFIGYSTSNIDAIPRGSKSQLSQIKASKSIKFLLNTFSETFPLSYIKSDAVNLNP
jgi:hypothetical protein